MHYTVDTLQAAQGAGWGLSAEVSSAAAGSGSMHECDTHTSGATAAHNISQGFVQEVGDTAYVQCELLQYWCLG